MFALSATLVLIDMTDHALVLVSLATGQILHRISLPLDRQPLALLATKNGRIYLFANGRTNSALYLLSDTQERLICLAHALPLADHVSLSPNGTTLYLACARRIYRFDFTAIKLTSFADTSAPCLLGADNDRLYSARPTTDGTLFCHYAPDGTLLNSYLLSGTVTTLHLQDDTCYLPFVQSHLHGEGLYRICLSADPPSVATIPVQEYGKRALSAYPYSVLLADDIIYLACESAATITRIDARTNQIIDCICLGRSISNLYALPDSRFALATSNMFADLVVVDLVNCRLLTLSICPHELFHHLLVLA